MTGRARLRGLLIAACVLLAGCSVARGPADPGQGVLSFLTTPATASTSILNFSAGQLDVLDLVVKVSGDDLRVNAPTYCRADRQDILCTVPTVPAGKNFILPMKGSNLSAVATYKRASGTAYSSEARK
ncbi:hypothetical protein [uncultured Deinococcus sp.]|uniref:hypothetical protein n=1 Tax=uncultured Deinococcus sp. TaxID=158789 RepID=UPI002587804A|nr:hypothetical protein [uncultured Deinococcus sp.]